MKISNIRKIEDSLNDDNYPINSRNQAIGWDVISIAFQIINLVICVYGLNIFVIQKLPNFTGQVIFSAAFSITLVIGWEFLKRGNLFDFFTNILNKPKLLTIAKRVTLSIILIIGSMWMAYNGAYNLTNQTSTIKKNFINEKVTKLDSIEAYYNNKIEKIDSNIQYYNNRAMNDARILWKEEKLQINTLKKDKFFYIKERNQKLDELKNFYASQTETEQEINQANSNIFLIFIFIFEIMIILGIYQYSLYKVKSYKIISNSDKFRKYKLFDLLLKIVYKNGEVHKMTNMITQKEFEEIITNQNIDCTPKERKEFLTLLDYLNITELKGRRKQIILDFENAITKMDNYFRI